MALILEIILEERISLDKGKEKLKEKIILRKI